MKNYTNTRISAMALSLAFLFANPLFAQNDSADSTLGGGGIAKIPPKARQIQAIQKPNPPNPLIPLSRLC